MGCDAVVALLIVSILLQLCAAVMALVLIKRSGFTLAWALVSTAIVLMTVRRITSLMNMFRAGTAQLTPIAPEIIALVISMSLFVAMILLLPAFGEIRRREDASRVEVSNGELLLRESRHDVKNDLQLLQSLVSLQQDAVRDPSVSSFLSDLSLRIRALSLVHEQIYQPDDGESFTLYVQGMVDGVRKAFAGTGRRVQLVNDVVDIPLSRSEMLHCGLILNEALTNAMKHAFDGVCEPRIDVVSRNDDGMRVLEIRDNGVGMPASVDSDGFGTRLIDTIVEAEGWALEIESNGGTTVRLVM